MSDRMIPIPFASLMDWILSEHKQGSVFGVRRPFVAKEGRYLDLFTEHLETPFGPAAGPHTQLAQNIIAAYFAGARFFELKTVQTLDGEDLPVSKPCILANDEGYNVEWSTELRVPEAFDEYVKAWFALKLLSKEFGLGAADGFMFNMSVGYNYEGITSKKIDDFIEGLKNAEETPIWKACMDWAKANLARFEHIDESYLASVSPKICTSGTLSTLHGCPPQEIERIASYLIEEKKLNTFVKCNPTLLGYSFCRKTLDGLGFDYIAFDEFHFNDDLQYRDAVPMFKRLLAKAAENNVTFGLKLSNTFPVQILSGELPGNEMYMSGRALYPLTIEMAHRLSAEFDGQLRLSFSGGVDTFTISALYGAGIWPITLATTLLKPGGYQRLSQMAFQLQSKSYLPFHGVSVGKVSYLAELARRDPRFTKPTKAAPKRKLDEKVPLVNCFTAPCSHGCPIGQDIPAYLELVGKGESEKALRLIVEKNPLPSVTGRICPHHCQEKCTRNFMEDAVHIREAKRAAVRGGFDAFLASLTPPAKTHQRVAVVGGGPGGMAASFFLARQGADVTLYEKNAKLGGIVRYVIPSFRISDKAVDRDAQLVTAMGVTLKLGAPAPAYRELKDAGFDFVVYAVGAWGHGNVALEAGESMNVLDFLAAYKAGEALDLGPDVVVIGGGNTAMDAARAAKRVPGVKHSRIVYRRTKQFMPADEEELNLALEDGVEFVELTAPVSLTDGKLLCKKMVLGEPDASGRRSPRESGEFRVIPATTVISAIGEHVDPAAFTDAGVALTDRGRVIADPLTLETNVKGVYVVGDANRGPATVVEAIADARRVADAIVGPYHYEIPAEAASTPEACYAKQGVIRTFDCSHAENQRCLACGTVCECCVTVCPNRANVAIDVTGEPMPAIVHVDNLCNECGNCLVFCPYDSAPYKEKLTLFSDEKSFESSENPGFLQLAPGKYRTRLAGKTVDTVLGEGKIDPAVERIIATVEKNYGYLLNL